MEWAESQNEVGAFLGPGPIYNLLRLAHQYMMGKGQTAKKRWAESTKIIGPRYNLYGNMQACYKK